MKNKRFKKNAIHLNKQFAGTAKPKKRKHDIKMPDYVIKGEAPEYIQWNISHPFQGGGVSPK